MASSSGMDGSQGLTDPRSWPPSPLHLAEHGGDFGAETSAILSYQRGTVSLVGAQPEVSVPTTEAAGGSGLQHPR